MDQTGGQRPCPEAGECFPEGGRADVVGLDDDLAALTKPTLDGFELAFGRAWPMGLIPMLAIW